MQIEGRNDATHSRQFRYLRALIELLGLFSQIRVEFSDLIIHRDMLGGLVHPLVSILVALFQVSVVLHSTLCEVPLVQVHFESLLLYRGPLFLA